MLAVYALVPASRRQVVSWCESKHQEALSSYYYDSFFRSVRSNKNNNNKREKIYAGKQGKKCRNQGGRERAWDHDWKDWKSDEEPETVGLKREEFQY